jgi:glycosyltransferase involved in cell wall biosynthesis
VASVIGDGSERPRAEALAAELGISGSVRFHGTLPEAVRLFPAFDAFVMSSRTEGTPLVLFEAMSAGVPIVTTAVGGVPDMVGGGQALLVPAADPEALAEAIRRVRDDPEATVQRVHGARIRLADFSVAPWLARYEELYESVRRVRSAAGMPA